MTGRGFDTTTPLSGELAQKFSEDGYRFCLRYVSLGTDEAVCDLSYDEAVGILDAGLALMAVQHVWCPGWKPTGALGSEDGEHAAHNAQSVGLPPGINLWCDLEGVADLTSAQDVIDYCNNWYNAVSSAGYVPGLYVGDKAILTADQLYQDLEMAHYWKSASDVPCVSVRGYQMIQHKLNVTVNRIPIDEDTAQMDNLGGLVKWLVR